MNKGIINSAFRLTGVIIFLQCSIAFSQIAAAPVKEEQKEASAVPAVKTPAPPKVSAAETAKVTLKTVNPDYPSRGAVPVADESMPYYPSNPSARGSISLELKKGSNIDTIGDKIQNIASQNNATVRNYTAYPDHQSGKKRVNFELQLNKDKAAKLLASIAQLGTVKSQNFNDNNNYNPLNVNNLKKKLETYKKYLEKILALPKPDIEVLSLFTTQIQNLESQIQNAERMQSENSGSKATINVEIKETGYPDGYNMYNRTQTNSIPWNTVIPGVTAIVCFLLGLLVSRISGKKNNL